ncbi:MAG: chloride channel protein [Oscillospiraceae bacterium]|nr:chloride channel protein [Oscillospiraceae bacterium]
MAWQEKLRDLTVDVKTLFKWGFLGLLIGAVGGVLGAVFHHALHFVTHLRLEHTWFIWLLPLAGLATVAIYRLPPLRKNRGTNEIIDAVLEGRHVSTMVAPAIFVSTAITHLFGGSAGREGAALQIGGSMASLLSKGLKLQGHERRVMIMSGMSAVFAGLFGTPLTAMLFCMEFETVGTLFSPALLPCFLAAFTASRISAALGVHAETFLLETAAALNWTVLGRYAVLAVLTALLGIAMCWIFHNAEHLARHYVPNPWVRIALGGAVVTVMTLIVGDHRFNGAGMDMALAAVAGETDWYSFAVKLLFTAVTLAAGFKGGEIVPTFCIGATFGCLLGGLLGLDAGLAAAAGLVGLFCCVTNSPLASIVLSMEMFGGANLYLFSFVCVICFVLSGKSGLYASQIFLFNKSAVESGRKIQ